MFDKSGLFTCQPGDLTMPHCRLIDYNVSVCVFLWVGQSKCVSVHWWSARYCSWWRIAIIMLPLAAARLQVPHKSCSIFTTQATVSSSFVLCSFPNSQSSWSYFTRVVCRLISDCTDRHTDCLKQSCVLTLSYHDSILVVHWLTAPDRGPTRDIFPTGSTCRELLADLCWQGRKFKMVFHRSSLKGNILRIDINV